MFELFFYNREMINEIMKVFTTFVISYTFLFAAAAFTGGASACRTAIGSGFITLALVRPFPVLNETVFVLSLVLSALLVLKKEYSISEFAAVVAGFIFALLCAAGAEYLRSSFTRIGDEWSGVIAGLAALMTGIIVSLAKKAHAVKLYYEVGITDSAGRERKFKGYLDTGNALYDEGEAVIIISDKAAKKVGVVPDGYMALGTVSGVGVLPKTRLNYKIYYDKNKHKLYSTPALISDKMGRRGYDVLIHKDMK